MNVLRRSFRFGKKDMTPRRTNGVRTNSTSLTAVRRSLSHLASKTGSTYLGLSISVRTIYSFSEERTTLIHRTFDWRYCKTSKTPRNTPVQDSSWVLFVYMANGLLVYLIGYLLDELCPNRGDGWWKRISSYRSFPRCIRLWVIYLSVLSNYFVSLNNLDCFTSHEPGNRHWDLRNLFIHPSWAWCVHLLNIPSCYARGGS